MSSDHCRAVIVGLHLKLAEPDVDTARSVLGIEKPGAAIAASDLGIGKLGAAIGACCSVFGPGLAVFGPGLAVRKLDHLLLGHASAVPTSHAPIPLRSLRLCG